MAEVSGRVSLSLGGGVVGLAKPITPGSRTPTGGGMGMGMGMGMGPSSGAASGSVTPGGGSVGGFGGGAGGGATTTGAAGASPPAASAAGAPAGSAGAPQQQQDERPPGYVPTFLDELLGGSATRFGPIPDQAGGNEHPSIHPSIYSHHILLFTPPSLLCLKPLTLSLHQPRVYML